MAIQEENYLEQIRDRMVAAMETDDAKVRDWAKSMKPYGQVELTPEEEDFLFDNMAVAYQKEGASTNAEAMAMYREDYGPEALVELYENVYRRRFGDPNVSG